MFASMVSGQIVIFDGENGQNPWWNVGGATVEVVNWLQKDAVNGSDYGATIWRVDENDTWAGGGITLDLDISAYNKISVDVLKKISGTVQIELQDGDARAYLSKDYTPTGSWQTLVFDIPEDWTHLSTLLIALHLVNTTENPIPADDNENHRMSWDNVKVYYAGITTVLDVPASAYQLTQRENGISISVDQPSEVAVYTVYGTLLTRLNVVSETDITLDKGLYLIRVNDAAVKTIVR